MKQGNLFEKREKTGKPSIEDRFRNFDSENPHIFRGLMLVALKLRRGGRSRYGVKALFERFRWDGGVITETGEDYKLSNDYTALYARKLMEECMELRGFFALRPRSEDRKR